MTASKLCTEELLLEHQTFLVLEKEVAPYACWDCESALVLCASYYMVLLVLVQSYLLLSIVRERRCSMTSCL